MNTVQLRLLAAHVLALLTVLTGDIVGSTVLVTAGFAGVFLTLGALFLLMTVALVGGVATQPVSILPPRRAGR